ncbi:hypothetical protein A5685_18845 [Mycobacterium colombiense]|uniref:Uncharacterized protein n=1 Tax=Mycobacterium colombiense TaxID=339268 RepID=A0A1A2SPA9_9MYCO|nr:hypothetical protein A5685_18845 [Mycobacterium colombiense]
MHTIEADYLVVGAGAMGMALIDTLVTETEARVVVDRHHAPGGHWTMAYPCVRLHQPSAFYGVNSSRLGSDTIDQVGWNRGLFEVATAREICAYTTASCGSPGCGSGSWAPPSPSSPPPPPSSMS